MTNIQAFEYKNACGEAPFRLTTGLCGHHNGPIRVSIPLFISLALFLNPASRPKVKFITVWHIFWFKSEGNDSGCISTAEFVDRSSDAVLNTNQNSDGYMDFGDDAGPRG